MRTLMTGTAWVHYTQLYVESAESVFFSEPDECFGGQQNGLCGAVVPGAMFLITGLHTGTVGFSVELYDDEPPLDETWEEIVEASFRPVGEKVALAGWGGEWQTPLDLRTVDYRVRYCGTGMDAAYEADTGLRDEPAADRYVLQFWPAPPAPDRVVKVTSKIAAYWHEHARELPATAPDERAEAMRQAELQSQGPVSRGAPAVPVSEWGEPLRISDRPNRFALPDRSMSAAIARADAGSQRAIARWAARRAYENARLSEHDWIIAGFDAIDRGAELPEPFSDPSAASDRVWDDVDLPYTDGRYDNFERRSMALRAILEASTEDPLRAAILTLVVAIDTFARGREEEFFAELREAFPVLAGQA